MNKKYRDIFELESFITDQAKQRIAKLKEVVA